MSEIYNTPEPVFTQERTGAESQNSSYDGYTPPSYDKTNVNNAGTPPSQNYQGTYSYQQPYYDNRYATPTTSPKDHVAAGLLAIFLGGLGIHKFYLGYTNIGFIMLAITIVGGIFTLGIASAIMEIIAFIEGIIYLTRSQAEFEQTYVFNKKEWF
ncbi:MAG: TM2 domain-containing protein [Eggerthellaceae bacterium]